MPANGCGNYRPFRLSLKSASFKKFYESGLTEFVKMFSYYLRTTIGLKDPKKSLHSFRHLVTNHPMVMESMIEELTGRAGKTETRKRYAKGYRVQTLYEEAVLKLDYVVGLSGIMVDDLMPT